MTRLITESTLACARVHSQLSNKHNLVLYLDKELVTKSKELGFNLSRTFENHLKQLITQLSNQQSTQNQLPIEMVGRTGFGPATFCTSSRCPNQARRPAHCNILFVADIFKSAAINLFSHFLT
jgi:post-segregation antitoxin (ccd killing protein)